MAIQILDAERIIHSIAYAACNGYQSPSTYAFCSALYGISGRHFIPSLISENDYRVKWDRVVDKRLSSIQLNLYVGNVF